jgi:hypothetical protein
LSISNAAKQITSPSLRDTLKEAPIRLGHLQRVNGAVDFLSITPRVSLGRMSARLETGSIAKVRLPSNPPRLGLRTRYLDPLFKRQRSIDSHLLPLVAG